MIDISKIYENLKRLELDQFEDGGPYDPSTDFDSNTLLALNPELSAGASSVDLSDRLPLSDYNVIPRSLDYTGTRSPGFTPNLVSETNSVSNDDVSALVQNALTSLKDGREDTPNYDNLSFGEAWRRARSKVGPSGTFEYKGRMFNTKASSDSNTNSNASKSVRQQGLSGEESDFSQLKAFIESNTGFDGLENYSRRNLQRILDTNSGSGEAQDYIENLLKKDTRNNISSSDIANLSNILPNKSKKSSSTSVPKPVIKSNSEPSYDLETGTFNINGTNYTRERLNAVNSILKKSIQGGESKHGYSKVANTLKIINRNNDLLDGVQEYKDQRKVNDMKFDNKTGSIVFNGKRYNSNNKKELDNLRDQLNDLSYFGKGNSREAFDKLNSILRTNNNKKELGGEIEEFAYGGPYDLEDSPVFDPNTNSLLSPTGLYANNQKNLGANQQRRLKLFPDTVDPFNQNTPQFASVTDFAGVNRSGFYDNNYLDSVEKGLPNSDGYFIDPNTGNKIWGGNFTSPNESTNNNSSTNNQFNTFMSNMLSRNQDYDVPEDLRMIGESLAFNAKDNAKYTNDIDRGIATGLNVTRGVAAGLDALVGGAREVYSGYASQKRQQSTEDEFYKRQRQKLDNQKLQFHESGGKIEDLLAMFAQEDGNSSDQDKRKDLSPEQLMTGEYIQQAPAYTQVEPNAELERNEYVQHPDGEVQQVEGRTHGQGGEKLALEPGTTVISDKVKLGAKNAKTINKEYDLGIKASHTFADVVESFTKKIGLSKVNSEQEEYFKKLKDLTDKVEDPSTSEINNSFLSSKINDLEEKKALLEASRSQFTDYIYNLQESHKSARGIENEKKENGGEISVHALGDEVPEEPKTLEELIALNNSIGTNSIDPSIGGKLWESLYYNPMNQWQQYLGMTPTNRKTHLDYQKDVETLLQPQLKKLIESGEMGLTNKHRELLKKAGIKDYNSKTSFKQLSDEEKQKLGDVNNFVLQGYADGLAGHRGVSVVAGDLNEEEYQKLTGSYDKLTDAEGRKIYAKYNPDGSIQRTKDGKIAFYYPKTGAKVPENKAPEDNKINSYQAPNKREYQAPYLPSQRPVAPTPASPVPIYETRLDRIDPVKIGSDQQVAEIYRQASATSDQFDGLTDSQRASAISNLSANTQQNVAGVVNNVAVQNAMNEFNVQQTNLQQSNAEEQARLSNAQYSDNLWMRTQANQEADNRDYQEALQRIKLGRFRYLQKDRQIQDMIENFKVGADGSIEFDPNSAQPITIGGVEYLQDKNGKVKKVDQVKRDAKGNVISSTTTTTKKP